MDMQELQHLLGLPDLLDVPSLMVVEPHPDDNEVGAGATIKLLTNRGAVVIYVTVTDGRAGGGSHSLSEDDTIQIRQRERQRASDLLAVSENHQLGFPDGGDWTERELVQALTPLIRQYRPAVVMTVDPWTPYESHPDHVKTGKGVATAAAIYAENPTLVHSRQAPYAVPQVAFYGTAYPNRFVDVSTTWADKLQAMQAHPSQFDTPQWPLVSGFLTNEAERLYRQHCGSEESGYAEAFKVLSSWQLHFFPEAVRY